MPKFAANLSFQFQEVGFLDRFEAAARAGFRGVEYLFPYEFPAEEIAKRLTSPKLTQTLFNLPPAQAPREQCEAVYVRNLRLAAAKLKAHGIRLLIEPINTRDIPGYFLSTVAQARRVMERVGSDNLFLQMDLYHCQVMEGDLASKIRANFDVIRHSQVAGNPGRHEPDVGEINNSYLFDLMDELGYKGWVGCEYKPRGETVAGLGWARKYGIGPQR